MSHVRPEEEEALAVLDQHPRPSRPQHNLEDAVESDNGNGDWWMPRSLIAAFRRLSALIPGFRQLKTIAASALLYPSHRDSIVPAEIAIDSAHVDLEESPNNLIRQDPISDTYRGMYRGRAAQFRKYRVLETYSRRGIDVKKVAISQTLLRVGFPGPGLVAVVGIWEPNKGVDDRSFLVETPVPESVGLAKYLAQNPHGERRLLLKDVVEALAHVHTNHLILGPMTQQSVTISPTGRAYLRNFDYLRSEDPTIPFSPMITSLDTLRYTAPEIMRPLMEGKEESPAILTKASDVYSLGCFIFELFTGQKPFTEYTQYPRHLPALLKTVTEGAYLRRPADGHTQGSGMIEEVWVLIEACCAPNPAERPSALDVLQLSFLEDLTDDR